MSSGRKRVISSCVPCYTRKQKCNRSFPCNHCTRRQRTEGCYYYSTNGSQTTSPPVQSESRTTEGTRPASLHTEWDAFTTPSGPAAFGPWEGPSLADSFGYFHGSNGNTMALIRKAGLAPPDSPGVGATLSAETADEVHRIVERMPDQQIINFLVHYFATEVNWIDQTVQISWFLANYQDWRTVQRLSLVSEVDFGVLILRICSYTLQFLPSPGYTLDTIRGVSLAEIRNICDETAESLEAIAVAAESHGSLIRVQHLAFFGLQCQIEAKTDLFRDALNRAMRTAHNIGLHCRSASPQSKLEKAHQEMERRTFCCLFIWDSQLARQLDRIPSHPGRLRPENWPQLPSHYGHKNNGNGSSEKHHKGPDEFTERILQAQLAEFWRCNGPTQRAEYDMIMAEGRYDKFCGQFISQLPPAFAISNPDESWDKRCPKLSMQRKLLHIAIYDSIFWNFRPLLLRRPEPIPPYKSFILAAQKRKIAAAALLALESVRQLHTLLGSCHTRLPVITFTTFEAAVLLVWLYTEPMWDEECPPQHIPPPGTLKADPLQATVCCMTRPICLEAINTALQRLNMLAEVNSMADTAFKVLTQLWANVTDTRTSTSTESTEPLFTPSKESSTGSAAAAIATTALATPSPTVPPTTSASAISSASLEPTMPAHFDLQHDMASSWLHADLAHVRGINEIPSLQANGSLVAVGAGDFGDWTTFDASGIYSQHPWNLVEFQ